MQRMKCISVCSLSSCCWLLNEVGYLVYPETKGVPLEEMDAVFGEGARVSALYGTSSGLTTELDHRTVQRTFATWIFSGTDIPMCVSATVSHIIRPHE